MKVWFVENREKAGPVSAEELPALQMAGRIDDETLIWHQYLDDWTPFKDCKVALLPNQSPTSPPFGSE
jgi:hypothetical protein